MHLHAEIQVCGYCLQFIANGEVAADAPETIVDDITRRWGELAQYLCVGDSEKDTGFSWDTCQGCGQALGGDRYHAVVLCKHPECSLDREEVA